MIEMDEDSCGGLGELEELPRFRNHRVYQVITTNNQKNVTGIETGEVQERGADKHKDYVQIPPNSKFTFDELMGPGKITNIWFTATPLADENPKNPLDGDKMDLNLIRRAARSIVRMWKYRRFPHLLQKVWIKIYFDGSKRASVNAPLGTFFCSGFGRYKHFMSRYVGMTGGGYISQFRMPFKKNARVEIVNTADDKVCLAFYGAVSYNRYQNTDSIENMGYFHAEYNREYPTTEDVPYTVLDVDGGRGHFLGFVLNAVNVRRKDGFAYLEGNTKFYVDGEDGPSIEFTGTEDIFQGAWYYINTNRGQSEFSEAYHGLTLKTFNKYSNIWPMLFAKHRYNKTSQYRFFPEGIPFLESLRVQLHHGEFDEVAGNYDSCVYYYHEKQ